MLTEQQKKQFMIRAIELSREHMLKGDGGPFGAVIVKGDQIIGEGWNCVTSQNDPTAHAEVMAIRKACEKLKTFDLSGCVVFTSCEPCPMCLSAIYWARLGEIYYANTRSDAAEISFSDDYIYQEVAKTLDQRSIPIKSLMRDQAFEVFKEWQHKSDKIQY